MKLKILQGSIVLLTVGVGIAALAGRSSEPVRVERRPIARASLPVPVSPPMATARPEVSPPASSDVVAVASYEAKVRTTYENYRSALVTGNTPLVDALRPVLLRDREIALGVARQEMQSSRSPADRETALRILETLERAR